MNANGNTTFGFVLFAILLLIIFFAGFGFFSCRGRRELFENGCNRQDNFNDPKFLNQRFFHFNNTDQLVSTDPVHVDRQVVQSALLDGRDMDGYFGGAKKKSL